METALALMVVLPKRQGGLGYSDIAMNQRLDIPASLKTSMSSKYLEADLFSKKAGVVIEYDGENHGELKRRTHDADRTGALELMGYKVRTLTSRHFSGKLEMHRAMNGIAKMLGVRPDVSADFQERQSALRERLIEGWDVNGG